MTSSNVLLFPVRTFHTTNFHGHWFLSMVITQGVESPPAIPDFKKPGQFRNSSKLENEMLPRVSKGFSKYSAVIG